MKNKETFIHDTLKEIGQILKEKYKDNESTGVLAGTSGIALFQFYYSKFLDTEEYADIGVEILTDGIDRINKGFGFPTYCSGLAGTGWVLDHLEQENFMDVKSDKLLSNLDNYLGDVMVSNMKEDNYDFLHGALGYGFYFLKRYKNTTSRDLKNKYKNYLLKLIMLLEKASIKKGDVVKWGSTLNMITKEKGYNIGLAHGMPSIVNFLSRIYLYDDFKKEVQPLLKGGVAYILSLKNEGNTDISLFPSWVKEGVDYETSSRLAWCYGDLGVGVSLWQASKSLEDKKLRKTAVETFKHAASRTSPESSMVKDAGLCHGSFGNAQIFNRMYTETGEKEFQEASAFWISDGLGKAVHNDGYAGFKQWRGQDKEWRGELSILEGIAGIGLSIISHLSGDNSWDECLMIG